MLQDADTCLDLLVACNRLPEATFFARTYRPSRCSEMLNLWKGDLSKVNSRASQALADPAEYPNLFPSWQMALDVEQQWETTLRKPGQAATSFPVSEECCERNSSGLVCPLARRHVHVFKAVHSVLDPSVRKEVAFPCNASMHSYYVSLTVPRVCMIFPNTPPQGQVLVCC